MPVIIPSNFGFGTNFKYDLNICVTRKVMKGAIEQKLKPLDPLHTEIVDFSDGCGLKFDVKVVSKEFEGKSLVDRHRIVHKLLEEEMKSIHALTLKTLTPSQWSHKPS